MPTPQKEASVASLKESVQSSAGMYLAEFSGITADGMTDLRNRIAQAGASLQVAKNRLMKRAVDGTFCEGVSGFLTGPTAIMFCQADPIGPAKVIKEFAKALDPNKATLTIKAAFIDGTLFDTVRSQALADLPPLDEIKGGVVGAIAGPVNTLVYTLNGVASDLVYTLQAVADKRESQ